MNLTSDLIGTVVRFHSDNKTDDADYANYRGIDCHIHAVYVTANVPRAVISNEATGRLLDVWLSKLELVTHGRRR
jgi:hypothetical protein